MSRAQAPRVIDRSRRPAATVRVDHGLGYETLLALMVLGSRGGGPAFETGPALAAYLDSDAGRPLARAMEAAGTTAGWQGLVRFLADAPGPHDRESLMELVRKADPARVKSAIVAGETETEGPQPGVDPRDPAALKDAVVATLEAFADDAVGGLGAAAVLAASAAGIRSAATRLAAEAVVELATGGIAYAGEAGIETILLVPTLVHRPWTLILDQGTTKVFCYAIVEPLPDDPVAALAALHRAVADPTRLRILQRLRRKPTTLGRLAVEFGMSKSTIHKHLLVLRRAELVQVDLERGYTVRSDMPDLGIGLRKLLGG